MVQHTKPADAFVYIAFGCLLSCFTSSSLLMANCSSSELFVRKPLGPLLAELGVPALSAHNTLICHHQHTHAELMRCTK